MPGLSLYLLNARYLFFVPSKREIACRRRRRRIFSTSRDARLTHTKKRSTKTQIKKKRGLRLQLHLALFGVALKMSFSFGVARKIRANDLLVVLVVRSRSSPLRPRQNEEIHPRVSSKKKGRTWEVRTRFLHRRCRRAIRAPPRTRGRRNRSSARSQGSGRASVSSFYQTWSSSSSSLKVVVHKVWGNNTISLESVFARIF